MNEKKFVKIIKKTIPAVVSIVLAENVSDLQKELKVKLKKSDVRLPLDKVNKNSKVEIGGGSGFFVSDSGLILTNKHVLAASSKVNYQVITSDERKFNAKIISSDPLNDIAILKIDDASNYKFPFLNLGDSSGLELGQFVLAFGNVLGIFKNTVSFGIVSGLSRAVKTRSNPTSPVQEMRGLIQTDVAINPGNSGGPLVDSSGLVVGINMAIVSGAQNISFAIPINAAKKDLADIKKFGRIVRPFLGIRFLSINQELKEKLNLPVDFGILITKEHSFDKAVIPQSPADLAGLEENDIILSWNGKTLKGDNIQDLLENAKVGENVTLKVLRGKNFMFETKLVVGERKI